MATKEEYVKAVGEFFDGKYEVKTGNVVPSVGDLTFGKIAKEMELAILFVDLRESTKIVDGFRRQTAAKMYKSFLWGIAKIARQNGGELRSFNGDGVLVVFSGDTKCSMAAKSAMQMSWFIQNLLKPKVDSYLTNNLKTANMSLNFGIGIDVGTVLIVRGGVRGENNNDLVWVGNATNYAVKLSGESHQGIKIRITPNVYAKLMDASKFGTNSLGQRVGMWEKVTGSDKLGGIPIYRTSWTWAL